MRRKVSIYTPIMQCYFDHESLPSCSIIIICRFHYKAKDAHITTKFQRLLQQHLMRIYLIEFDKTILSFIWPLFGKTKWIWNNLGRTVPHTALGVLRWCGTRSISTTQTLVHSIWIDLPGILWTIASFRMQAIEDKSYGHEQFQIISLFYHQFVALTSTM